LRFRDLIVDSRAPDFSDPAWFVANWYGARLGKGSRELLSGVGVDPKCNPVHRYAVQYLADTGLLQVLSDLDESDSFALSVSFFDEKQESMNKTILLGGRAHQICLIVLSSTVISMNEDQFPEIKEGSVICFPVTADERFDNFRISKGETIAVVVGSLDAPRSCFPRPSVNAQIVLKSMEYEGFETANRRAQSEGEYSSLIACPDCRRPIQAQIFSSERNITPVADQNPVIITVICDEEEGALAVETGTFAMTRYNERILLATNESFITDELRAVYTRCGTVKPLSRWSKKRGLKDYAVPTGYVCPALIPKGTELTLKDTMYTIIQALGVEELWGRSAWLVEPSGQNGVEVIPSKSMYSQITAELREWSHPCHRPRHSAIELVRDWVNAYV
jgi:hypothetical protein